MAWEYSAQQEVDGVVCYTERRDSETGVTEAIQPVPVDGAGTAEDAVVAEAGAGTREPASDGEDAGG